MSSDGVHVLAEETRAYGARDLETGGFLLAPTGSDYVSGVALAGTSGIVHEPFLFQISERALDRLFTFADDQQLWIPIQFHSHRFGAHMSRTDAEHGLRVEGFVNTIIPGFAEPSEDVSQWSWWQFRDGAWQAYPPIVVNGSAPAQVILFDEDGVRER
jgi:hypothetical protein